MRFVAAVAVLVVGYVPTAWAQSSEWVVVPASTNEDTTWMQPTASSIGAALSERQIRVMTPAEAAVQFEEKGSAPSTTVTDSDIDEWVTSSREAIRHLARGDYGRALEELKKAQMISRKAVDELNREKTRSQNVLDTCLYLVRALLETGNRSRARTQTHECVRLVPRGEPNPHMHPPSVISLYESASQAGPEETGALVVTSEPSGCEVRINGLRFGQTPFEMAGLYQGKYQVQVECKPSDRGRVHPATVGPGRTEVFVDVELDRAIRTDPLLHLQYEDKALAKGAVRDAKAIANVVGAGAVVLATTPSIDMMELQVVSGSEQLGGLVRIPSTPRGPTYKMAEAAAAALANGDCKDLTGPRPVDIDCTLPKAEAPPKKTREVQAKGPGDRPPRGQWIAGLTLVSVGGASLATGYGLLIARRNVIEAGTNSSDPDGVRWVNLHYYILIAGPLGGAAATAAMPLVLPYRNKTPWWAWMSGGFGAGFLIASVVSAATAEGSTRDTPRNDCWNGLSASDTVTQTCIDRGQQIDRAYLFGFTAAPLLTMPLVYLLRKPEKKTGLRLEPRITAGRTGGYFGLNGVF